MGGGALDSTNVLAVKVVDSPEVAEAEVRHVIVGSVCENEGDLERKQAGVGTGQGGETRRGRRR